MQYKKLSDVLGPRPEETTTLRWRVTVPLATNPLLLFELFQLAFVGACIVLLVLCVGLWLSEGGIAFADVMTSLRISGMVLFGVMAGFIGISVLFFRNRYYATYNFDALGIFHEGTRGNDESKELFCTRFRPFPVVGNIKSGRTRSQHLSWHKVDRFQNFSSMRVILLQRGHWHMLRLYTPDAVTHAEVVRYLAERLRQI